MAFFAEITKTGIDEQHNLIFQKFSNELGKLDADSQEKIAFEYFDFKSWVDSKIIGKAMASLLSERAPTKNIL